MIFTGEHYYLGLIQAALAVFYVLFGVFVAGRSRVFDRVGAWLIGAYLLMYKFNEYGPFRTVPLDLPSSVCQAGRLRCVPRRQTRYARRQ